MSHSIYDEESTGRAETDGGGQGGGRGREVHCTVQGAGKSNVSGFDFEADELFGNGSDTE